MILQDYFFPALNKDRALNAVLDIKEFFNRDCFYELSNQVKQGRGTYYWNGKYKSIGHNYMDRDYTPKKEKKWINVEDSYITEINKFIELSTQYSIKLFLIEPPKPIGSMKPSIVYPEFINLLKEKYPHIGISDIFLSTYYETELFMDRGHLNYNGAVLYTLDIKQSFERFIKGMSNIDEKKVD